MTAWNRLHVHRGVAQFGRPRGLGPRCWGFKSLRPDQKHNRRTRLWQLRMKQDGGTRVV